MDPKRHREVDVDFPRPMDFHADTGVETYLWGISNIRTQTGRFPKAISAKSHQTLCRLPQGVWTPRI